MLTNDGRVFTGLLKSFDQRMNIILADCFELVYTGKEKALIREDIGVYFIRGDNLALLGKIEPTLKEIQDEQGGDPIQAM